MTKEILSGLKVVTSLCRQVWRENHWDRPLVPSSSHATVEGAICSASFPMTAARLLNLFLCHCLDSCAMVSKQLKACKPGDSTLLGCMPCDTRCMCTCWRQCLVQNAPEHMAGQLQAYKQHRPWCKPCPCTLTVYVHCIEYCKWVLCVAAGLTQSIVSQAWLPPCLLS